MSDRFDAVAALTDGDGPFALETVDVRGHRMATFRQRARSLVEVMLTSADRYAERVVLVAGSERVTMSELAGRAAGVAAHLSASGVRQGDRVAILGPNSIAWIEAFWGTLLAGAAAVPLNAWWQPGQLQSVLDHSGSSFLFVDESSHVDLGSSSMPRRVLDGGDVAPAAYVPPEIGEDDLASIFYTSGTTGAPKGVALDHRGMVANLRNLVYMTVRGRIMDGELRRSADGARSQLVTLLAVPLFHVAGCQGVMVASLAFGNRLVINPPGHFDGDQAATLIEQEEVSNVVAVPTIVERLLAARSGGIKGLRTIVSSGAPLSADLADRVRGALGRSGRLSNSYGLTETNAAFATIGGRELDERPGSVGVPVPTADVKIAADDGSALPFGERGEVAVKGPMLMAGYWADPDATEAAVRDGYFFTGDAGYVDEDGYLYLVDRIKDIIIRGGENVSSVNVAHVLEAHPSVREAAVIGKPDHEYGEIVVAYVTAEGVSAEELTAWCRRSLPRYAVPAEIHMSRHPLPRNASGKLVKGELGR